MAGLFAVDGSVDVDDPVLPLGKLGQLHRGAVRDLLFQAQQQKIEEAPAKKRPVGPVPYAGEQPHNEEIPVGPPRALPASAQGDVHIVPEPGGQGDVPPPPELRHRTGEIGVVKII